MVAIPGTPEHLRMLRQVGIDDVVHYQMQGLPEAPEALRAIRDRYGRFGLSWRIAESGPAIDQIVLGKPGRDAQIQRYQRSIRELGELGVKVIVYNFMPQVGPDAMVIRTALNAMTRGGAVTTRFKLADLRADSVDHQESPISREQMWENLGVFLRAVIPVAEQAGVRLAMHPDDPPLSPLCGLERIMDRVESFDRLLSLDASSSNALTFCVGCFAEMGVEILPLIERYRKRIACVHVRNIAGSPTDFLETFPDDGDVDLPSIIEALHRIGYEGYVRSDHAPTLATDPGGTPEGYGVHGHLFAMGYLKGLIQAARDRRAPPE